MPIISAQRLRECQDFIDKVGEIRFNKLKQRQLNKFNLLTIRKEGNITRPNNTNININNLTIQAGSQINQTTSQANPLLLGKEAFLPRQVLSFPEKLAPLWQLLPLPGKLALLQQLLPFPGKEAVPPRQLLSFPEKLAPLWQLLPLPGKLAPLQQLLPFPGKEAVPPRQLLSFPEAVPLQQLLSFPGKEAVPPRQLLSPPGKEAVHPNQVLLITKTGQAGKTIGSLIVTGSPRLPRRIAPSPRKTIILPPHRSPPPKILFRKNLTLSGSLTSPENL